MWLNEYVQEQQAPPEPQREVRELDTKLTAIIQESMYGNFGGRLSEEAKEKSKVMFSGAIIGVVVAMYFGKSPLYFGVGGALIGKLISNKG